MSLHARVDPALTVAVIGAGFSGLLTATHLLERHPRVTVRLIEQADRFAAGRAYAAGHSQHLLNVRAANMSAFPDQPNHFVDWLAAQGREAGGDAFVGRGTYGEYLQSLLREALGEAGHPARLLLEQDEAVAVTPRPGGFSVDLAMGRTLAAHAVVLAVGLGPPRPPAGLAPALAASPLYAADPWRLEPDRLPGGDILLIGSGLTMVDTALSLARDDRRLVVISRRGLLPRAHAPTAPARLPDGPLDAPSAALRSLRALAAEIGWRSAVDGVRPLTPAIWAGWSLAERRRFLRHARPWWEAHRHRMAPPVARRIDDLRAAGRLDVLAARIEDLRPDGDGIAVRLRRRGLQEVETLRFAAVVNCTGLSGDLTGSPLLHDLARQGRLRRDPLRLGADVDPAFRVLDAQGAATPGLYAVGPLTRAARWEAVAVPDLRRQTAELAATVLDALAAREAATPA